MAKKNSGSQDERPQDRYGKLIAARYCVEVLIETEGNEKRWLTSRPLTESQANKFKDEQKYFSRESRMFELNAEQYANLCKSSPPTEREEDEISA